LLSPLLAFLVSSSANTMVHVFAVMLAFSTSVMAKQSQVFVMRHCFRQSADEAKHAKPEYTLLNHYTSHPLPEWGVPNNWCTEGGMKLAELAGNAFVLKFDVDPTKVSMTADPQIRDVNTAVAVLNGMKFAGNVSLAGSVEFNANLYSTTDPHAGDPVCPVPDELVEAASIRARFAEVPLPWDLEEAIQEFEEVFGVGVAGSLRDLGNVTVTEGGRVVGPVVVMKELSQNLLYSRASGLDYLVEQASHEQVTRFYAWQAYYRSVVDMSAEKSLENTWLLSRVLKDLEKPEHSTFHIGHDGNQDGFAAYFDLEWEAPGFLGGKLLPTPPLSAIRFVLDDVKGTVSASFLAMSFDTNFTSESAEYVEFAIDSWDIDKFHNLAINNLKRHPGAESCFQLAPEQQTQRTLV